MRFQKCFKLQLMTLVFLASAIASMTTAKGQTTPTARFGDANEAWQAAGANETENGEQYKITSQFLILPGTNKGYLVVQVDLAKGYHIYSLTQKGPLKPTQIRVAASDQFQLTSPFRPDRNPKVMEHDPVFGQRTEKHEGSVRFLAPVQIRSGVDVSRLVAEIVLDGQICSENGCMPINKAKVRAKFAGYIQPQDAKSPNERNAANAVGGSSHR